MNTHTPRYNVYWTTRKPQNIERIAAHTVEEVEILQEQCFCRNKGNIDSSWAEDTLAHRNFNITYYGPNGEQTFVGPTLGALV